MVDESLYNLPGVSPKVPDRDNRPLPSQKRPSQKQGGNSRKSGGQDFSDPVEILNNVADKFTQPQAPPKPPGFDRFGGLRPFEHHSVPEEMKDHF